MSYTVQKWDNNTAEIAYKLYAFDTDFIIEKEVLTGTSTESTYYNSNVSRETMAAAWTARASKTYDYVLKDNLVDNRFNRNFLAFEDSYSCSLFESARKGINIKVEDYPLLWIEGNGGSGYYDSYKGDTCEISGSGCVYGGGASDYNLITNIELENKSLTTDFNIAFQKFQNLGILKLKDNSIQNLNVTKNLKLVDLSIANNQIASIDITKNILLEVFLISENQLTSIDVTQNVFLNAFTVWGNTIFSIDVTQNILLKTLLIFDNQLGSIDITNNVALEILNIKNNNLSSIDITQNIGLKELDVWNNNLTSIDVSQNILLTRLMVFSNSLTSLDLSNNSLLTTLRCNNNRLNAAVNSQLLINLDGFGLSNGLFVGTIFGGGSLTSAGAAAKAALQGKGWTVTGL